MGPAGMGPAGERGAWRRAAAPERGCWFYLRYFFMFASLVQLLVIAGLVLFMVYGDARGGTEQHLRDTQRRAQALHTRLALLTAAHGNLSRELNATARARDAGLQGLGAARRELDRLNASFRQCQTDRAIHESHQQYMFAIILSEKQCLEQLKKDNRTCGDSMALLTQKGKELEAELTKERESVKKEKAAAGVKVQEAQGSLVECLKAQEQLRGEKHRAQEQLEQVRALCLPLERGRLESELRSLWRERLSQLPPGAAHFLDPGLALSPYLPLAAELTTARRACEQMPALTAARVEELLRGVRAAADSVTRDNGELRRLQAETQAALAAAREEQQRTAREAQQRETQLRAEGARQTALALEDAAALRRERDGLATELAARRRELEQARDQLKASEHSLDICMRAKAQLPLALPRPALPPNPPALDKVALEEYKQSIIKSQRLPPSG